MRHRAPAARRAILRGRIGGQTHARDAIDTGRSRSRALRFGVVTARTQRAISCQPPTVRARTMHRNRFMMTMKTVKRTINTLGDYTGDFAHDAGKLARNIGGETAELARRFGDGTVTLARRVGPKRGLIGLAVLAAAVGGSIMLIRYLKARNADASLDADEPTEARSNGTFANKRARAQHTAESFVSRQ